MIAKRIFFPPQKFYRIALLLVFLVTEQLRKARLTAKSLKHSSRCQHNPLFSSFHATKQDSLCLKQENILKASTVVFYGEKLCFQHSCADMAQLKSGFDVFLCELQSFSWATKSPHWKTLSQFSNNHLSGHQRFFIDVKWFFPVDLGILHWD